MRTKLHCTTENERLGFINAYERKPSDLSWTNGYDGKWRSTRYKFELGVKHFFKAAVSHTPLGRRGQIERTLNAITGYKSGTYEGILQIAGKIEVWGSTGIRDNVVKWID